MVHTVSVTEAALADSIAKLLGEDITVISAEANWWHPRIRIVENWLRDDANRAIMPDDGTEEMIRKNVQRGDLYPQTQLKCWKHIVLELRDLASMSGIDTSGHMDVMAIRGHTSPSRGKLRPGKELIILSDNVGHKADEDSAVAQVATTLPPTSSDASDAKAVNGMKKVRPGSSVDRRQSTDAAGGDGGKNIAGMSMMERQAEWLRKKQEKMEIERLRQEEEKEKELTFQPKIIRRATYDGDRPTKDAPPSTAATTAVAPPRPLVRGGSYGNSRKPDAGAAPSAGPKEKAIPKPPRSAHKGKRKKSQTQSPTQPIEISSDLLDSMKSELEASITAGNASGGPTDVNDADDASQCSENNDEAAADQEPTSNVASGDAVVVDDKTAEGSEDPARGVKSWSDHPMIAGRRVDFDSGDSKARLVLQDATRFDLSSMYRKTDRKAGRDGVALHMGRREDTFEEQVIAILFDKEKVSELEAARWWLDHEHRFAEFMRDAGGS